MHVPALMRMFSGCASHAHAAGTWYVCVLVCSTNIRLLQLVVTFWLLSQQQERTCISSYSPHVIWSTYFVFAWLYGLVPYRRLLPIAVAKTSERHVVCPAAAAAASTTLSSAMSISTTTVAGQRVSARLWYFTASLQVTSYALVTSALTFMCCLLNPSEYCNSIVHVHSHPRIFSIYCSVSP